MCRCVRPGPSTAGRPWCSRWSPSACSSSRSGWTPRPPNAAPASSSRPATAGRTPRSVWCSGAAARSCFSTTAGRRSVGRSAGSVLFWSLDGLAQSYVRYGVRADDALAGVNAALWVLNRFGAFLPMTVAVLLLIFPTGRFLEGRWGRVGQAALALMFLAALLVILAPANGRATDVALPPGVDLDAGAIPMSDGLHRCGDPGHPRRDGPRCPGLDGLRGRPLPPGGRRRTRPVAVAGLVGARDGGRARPLGVLRPHRRARRLHPGDRLPATGGHDDRHRPPTTGAGRRPAQRDRGVRAALGRPRRGRPGRGRLARPGARATRWSSGRSCSWCCC